MDVPFLDVRATYSELRTQLDRAWTRVADSGRYILGEEVLAFERAFASYCGAAHCVAVGNGLDALHLALRASGVGEGGEVIVPSHTFIATWLAVTYAGAVPVPVEPDRETHNIDPGLIERAITSRTRAIIPVHLYGQPAAMDEIAAVVARRGIAVIEDAAQAHGASYGGRKAGSLAGLSAFSFYPGKNLGAMGDGGAVLTSDEALAEEVRALRNYGSRRKYHHDSRGFNSRLDPLQAAILQVKLGRLTAWNERRLVIAERYRDGFLGVPGIAVPKIIDGAVPSWHLYVIRHQKRDALRDFLQREGVETLIHYPVPPHLSGAYCDRGWKAGSFPIAEEIAATVVSLPIGPHLTDAQVDYVIDCVRRFATA